MKGRPAATALLGKLVRSWPFALVFVLAAAVSVLTGRGGFVPEVGQAAEVRLEVEPLSAYRPGVYTEVSHGDTIESVCRRLAREEWPSWRDSLAAHLDPRKLRPGTAFEGACTPGGALEELRVALDPRREIRLVRKGGGIRFEQHERPLETEVVRVEGTIHSSLFAAVEKAGGDPDLAVRVAEIFQWDIDFLRDLRRGDGFVVLASAERVDGEFYRWGAIYAARFVNGNRTLDAFVYPDDEGRLGYYDGKGNPLRKQFLRSPLRFSRVTSRFTMRRFHPVLQRTMPHYGVDYGAPVGTPVMATADGVATLAGRNGGAGNMVTLRHPNGYETNYLHLSRYGPGVKRGARVAQGDVVGYVGSSGLSTGPHLDYRVKQNGRWINPLTLSSPPAEPLGGSRRARFELHAEAVIALLEGREPPAGARG